MMDQPQDQSFSDQAVEVIEPAPHKDYSVLILILGILWAITLLVGGVALMAWGAFMANGFLAEATPIEKFQGNKALLISVLICIWGATTAVLSVVQRRRVKRFLLVQAAFAFIVIGMSLFAVVGYYQEFERLEKETTKTVEQQIVEADSQVEPGFISASATYKAFIEEGFVLDEGIDPGEIENDFSSMPLLLVMKHQGEQYESWDYSLSFSVYQSSEKAFVEINSHIDRLKTSAEDTEPLEGSTTQEQEWFEKSVKEENAELTDFNAAVATMQNGQLDFERCGIEHSEFEEPGVVRTRFHVINNVKIQYISVVKDCGDPDPDKEKLDAVLKTLRAEN